VKTILVVDDELASAEVLSLILEEEGYRTFCAPNGRQGIDRAREVRPQLVVLDFMMPVMNGAEVGAALRGSPDTRHIKIVINSGLPEEAVRQHFEKYDAFLRKPYNVDVALKMIADLLADG
jgi:CheY-like chemotaxis protein